MHGLIITEWKRYVGATSGPDAWSAVCAEAGLAGAQYNATEAYANAELVVLVEATSRLTGTAVADLLESFGAYLVPALLTTYLPALPPAWGALDLLEHTESHCHGAARDADTLVNPPRLRVRRTSATEVQITYASPRRLCHIGRGIARGVLTHYRVSGSVSEPMCMHRGDAVCLITVRSSGN